MLIGSSAEKKDASASRALYTTLPASTDIVLPDLPGLAPVEVLKFIISASMISGFGQDVAALSRYIIIISHIGSLKSIYPRVNKINLLIHKIDIINNILFQNIRPDRLD